VQEWYASSIGRWDAVEALVCMKRKENKMNLYGTGALYVQEKIIVRDRDALVRIRQ
jgi:hypothetical protein